MIRALLPSVALLALGGGCLDFSILDTPLDGGAPADAALPPPDLQTCLAPTDGPSQCVLGTDCPGGRFCIHGSAGAPGLCEPGCSLDTDCTCAGSLCVNGGSGDNFCSGYCELAQNLGCPAGTGCDVATDQSNTSRSFTVCRGAGPQAIGMSCIDLTDCVAGSSCVGPLQGPAFCLQWCRLLGGDCPNGKTCLAASPAVRVANVSYGFCQ